MQRSYTQGSGGGKFDGGKFDGGNKFDGEAGQTNSGKSSLHKPNNFSHQGQNKFGDNPKRPYFQHSENSRNSHDRPQAPNSETTGNFNQGSSGSAMMGGKPGIQAQPMAHDQFSSTSQPQTPLSGGIRKRKTYDGRQKDLEGTSGGN